MQFSKQSNVIIGNNISTHNSRKLYYYFIFFVINNNNNNFMGDLTNQIKKKFYLNYLILKKFDITINLY